MNIKQKEPVYKLARGMRRISNKIRSMISQGEAIVGMLPILSTDIDYTLTADDSTLLVDTTGGNVEIFLPSAAEELIYELGLGRIYIIKRISAGVNTLDITPNGSETIDGSASYSLVSQHEFVVIQSDGTNWRIIG